MHKTRIDPQTGPAADGVHSAAVVVPRLPKSCAPPPLDRRETRWIRRQEVWSLTKLKGPAYCGRVARGSEVEFRETVDEAGESRASVHGLLSCGSIWACPVCASHLRHTRGKEVEQAADEWKNRGGRLLLLTLTLRHKRAWNAEQDAKWGLAPLMNGLMGAWRATSKGAAFERSTDRLGLLGWVRGTEVTVSPQNGWHPHLHLVLFVGEDCDEAEQARFEGWLTDRWLAKLAEQGYDALASVGVDMREIEAKDAGYPVKLQEGDTNGGRSAAIEVSRGDVKPAAVGSRVPFDLLDGSALGDRADRAKWLEYEQATKGRRALERSRGLLEELGVEEKEETAILDEQAGDELGAEAVRTLRVPAEDWAALCASGWSFDALGMYLVSDEALNCLIERARAQQLRTYATGRRYRGVARHHGG